MNVNPLFFLLHVAVQSANADQTLNNMAPNKKTRQQPPVLEVEKSKRAEELMPPPPTPPSAVPQKEAAPDTPRPPPPTCTTPLPLPCLTREASVHSEFSLTNLDRLFVEGTNKQDTHNDTDDTDDDYPPNRWSQQPRGHTDSDNTTNSNDKKVCGKRKRSFRPSGLFQEVNKKPRTVRDYYENCTFHFHIGNE